MNQKTSNQIFGGIFAVLTLLAIAVIFLDYAKNPTGPNQGLAIAGTGVTDLYGVAAGQQVPSGSFTNLSAFQA